MNEPAQATRDEPRWPPALAILAVLGLLAALPHHVQVIPAWVSYAVALAILVPMTAVALTTANTLWRRIERTVIMLFAAAYVVNTTMELADMIGIFTLHPPETRQISLLSSSAAIWVTNVLAFSLLYWQIDRGGSYARVSKVSAKPDWLFPQAAASEDTSSDWRPLFLDSRRAGMIAMPGIVAGVAMLLSRGKPSAADETAQADFLFVQNAKAMSFDKSTNKLTLEGISPITVMFTGRPERIAGNMRTAAFVPYWSSGKDSFLSDPPNADLSILEGDQLKQIVVTLRDPVLEGENLVYSVEVLQGEMPDRGADVSVFIDVIGMPLTPFSYAGVARRTYRRAVIY